MRFRLTQSPRLENGSFNLPAKAEAKWEQDDEKKAGEKKRHEPEFGG